MIGGVASQPAMNFQLEVISTGFGENSWENPVATIQENPNNQAYYDEKRAQVEVTYPHRPFPTDDHSHCHRTFKSRLTSSQAGLTQFMRTAHFQHTPDSKQTNGSASTTAGSGPTTTKTNPSKTCVASLTTTLKASRMTGRAPLGSAPKSSIRQTHRQRLEQTSRPLPTHRPKPNL